MSANNPADANVERIAAYLIDGLIFGIAISIIYVAFLILGPILSAVIGIGGMAAAGGADSAAVGAGAGLLTRAVALVLSLVKWGLIFGVYVGYFVFLQRSDGQTIGKSIMDIKVVDDSGGVPTQRQLVKRTVILYAPMVVILPALLLTIIPIVGGILGVVFDPVAFGLISLWVVVECVVMFVRDGVRLGDQFADTRVVET